MRITGGEQQRERDGDRFAGRVDPAAGSDRQVHLVGRFGAPRRGHGRVRGAGGFPARRRGRPGPRGLPGTVRRPGAKARRGRRRPRRLPGRARGPEPARATRQALPAAVPPTVRPCVVHVSWPAAMLRHDHAEASVRSRRLSRPAARGRGPAPPWCGRTGASPGHGQRHPPATTSGALHDRADAAPFPLGTSIRMRTAFGCAIPSRLAGTTEIKQRTGGAVWHPCIPGALPAPFSTHVRSRGGTDRLRPARRL